MFLQVVNLRLIERFRTATETSKVCNMLNFVQLGHHVVFQLIVVPNTHEKGQDGDKEALHASYV